MMGSDDYKGRFKAEYYQISIRLQKLEKMLNKWDRGELNFEPTYPREIYDEQIKEMRAYKNVLVKRATLENVDL